MQFQSINLSTEQYVTFISLKEEIGNQADYERLLYDMNDVCQSVSTDKDVRVIAIGGAERFTYLPATPLKADSKNLSIAEAISNIEKPVLAVVDGDVTGLALEMILACDIRLCTKKSSFGFNHVEQGMIPFDGGTQRLSRLVGKGKALEMILIGDRIDADEAYRIGLVNRVIMDNDPDNILRKLAVEMASNSPTSLNYAKETINAGLDMTLEQGLRLEADLYMLMHSTDDRTEGIRAFQEKRKPDFKGY